MAGTDPAGAGRTIAGYANRREIAPLVEGSFTPRQAIKICTLNGTKHLGRNHDIGTIEAGRLTWRLSAATPGRDIRQLRQMEIVFKHTVGFGSPSRSSR